MFLIVGRRPDAENALFHSDAKTWPAAKKEFQKWLWANADEGEREAREAAHGVDHYIEAAFEIKGSYKTLVDPQLGER
jgi:hypothetical protein